MKQYLIIAKRNIYRKRIQTEHFLYPLYMFFSTLNILKVKLVLFSLSTVLI